MVIYSGPRFPRWPRPVDRHTRVQSPLALIHTLKYKYQILNGHILAKKIKPLLVGGIDK